MSKLSRVMIMTSDFELRRMKPDAFVNFQSGFSYAEALRNIEPNHIQIEYRQNLMSIETLSRFRATRET